MFALFCAEIYGVLATRPRRPSMKISARGTPPASRRWTTCSTPPRPSTGIGVVEHLRRHVDGPDVQWRSAFDQDLGWCVDDDVSLSSAFYGTPCESTSCGVMQKENPGDCDDASTGNVMVNYKIRLAASRRGSMPDAAEASSATSRRGTLGGGDRGHGGVVPLLVLQRRHWARRTPSASRRWPICSRKQPPSIRTSAIGWSTVSRIWTICSRKQPPSIRILAAGTLERLRTCTTCSRTRQHSTRTSAGA